MKEYVGCILPDFAYLYLCSCFALPVMSGRSSLLPSEGEMDPSPSSQSSMHLCTLTAVLSWSQMIITVENVKEKLKDQVSNWEKGRNLDLDWKNYDMGISV